MTAQGHGPLRFQLLTDHEERTRWDALVMAGHGSLRQCRWWVEPLRPYGVRYEVLGAFRGRELVGGALVRAVKLPAWNRTVAECIGGPVLIDPRSFDERSADSFVASITDSAHRLRAIQVSLRFCPDASIQRSMLLAFSRASLRVSTFADPPDAVIDLRGVDSTDTAKLLHTGARRAVARARRHGLKVEVLTSEDDLRAAHSAISASAERQGIPQSRPWPALRPLFLHGVETASGEVLGIRLGGAVVAAIYVAHVGETSEFIYGGYLDAAQNLGATHLLQLEAMNRAIGRGATRYTLGMLSGAAQSTGLDQFKLGFGAEVRLAQDRIAWRPQPVVGAALWAVRSSRHGRRAVSLLRSTRIRRAGNAHG